MDWKRLGSARAAGIEASGIRKIFDLAASLKDPLDLSIGQPDFDVPEAVKEAAVAAIRGGFNRYTPSAGIPELKERLRADLQARQGARAEDVLVTAGVSGALTLALLALLDPGDEVLLPDPYFVSYKHLTTLCGGAAVYYDTYPDFRIDVERLEALVTPRTKVLLAMSPANPTGATIGAEARRALAALARRKNLVLISDEIYELFSYAPEAGPSLAALYPEGTLVLGGLSKTAALTGWRIGWALGPRELIQAMTKLQQFTFVCAPSFAQHAALAAFGANLAAAVPAYRAKRDRMLAALRALGYRAGEPGGAFYLFPEVPPGYAGGQAFVEEAARRKLLLVPGGVFSRRDTHFRLSYAAPDEKLERALEVFAALLRRGSGHA